jgi:hypothetical protein
MHQNLSQLSNAGGRLVIASDGVWDALSFQEALNYTRGLPAEAAAIRIVKVLKHLYIPGVSVPGSAYLGMLTSHDLLM